MRKRQMWLTRDKDDGLFLSIGDKPIKREIDWKIPVYSECYEISYTFFPEVKWSDDEPTKVKLVIDK